MPNWNHIASEIHVNRALRAPHEFRNMNGAVYFRDLGFSDNDPANRVLGCPARLGLMTREWVRFSDILVYSGQPSLVAHSRLEQWSATIQQIENATARGSRGAAYWSYVKMLD
ncbi:hypothetical protein J7T55_010681 [Diaporthe amygdali]|uniref:uncharacterized protein n=1 Tax=Phomopsis amygdali TaxID=1214568 RepID=UPI0022FDCF5E|nr:uncharacterized protein J7T55_010681 [Diaporthe amygdali]KAJ0114292.1 hypothetical protein J7T55_010681 [Diaporthe amygdali]